MSRIITWLTLIGIVFAAQSLITVMQEFDAKYGQYASKIAATGQTRPTAQDAAPAHAPASTDDQQPSDNQVGVEKIVSSPKTFEQQCEEMLPASTINTVVQEVLTVHDYAKSIMSLTELSENKTTLTLGLTVSHPQVHFVWNTESLQDKKTGRVCMRPQLYFSVNPGTQNVYVGKEFEQNTCSFKEILAHELLHVNANKKMAHLVADNMKKYVAASIGNRVIYGKDKKEVDGYVVDAIENHWIPFAKENFEHYKKMHENIDTQEEYARIHYSCNGEIPALLDKLKLKGQQQ